MSKQSKSKEQKAHLLIRTLVSDGTLSEGNMNPLGFPFQYTILFSGIVVFHTGCFEGRNKYLLQRQYFCVALSLLGDAGNDG